MEAAKCSSFTLGAWYDQMKFSLNAAAGNLRVGLFEDAAGEPTNRLSQSASVSPVANYTTNYAITEIQVNATVAWLAHNQDSATTDWAIWTNLGRYKGSVSSVALNDPFGTPTGNNNAAKMKISHT